MIGESKILVNRLDPCFAGIQRRGELHVIAIKHRATAGRLFNACDISHKC